MVLTRKAHAQTARANPHYEDYNPGTLLMAWQHFLKRFEELFSKDNFSMID